MQGLATLAISLLTSSDDTEVFRGLGHYVAKQTENHTAHGLSVRLDVEEHFRSDSSGISVNTEGHSQHGHHEGEEKHSVHILSTVRV